MHEMYSNKSSKIYLGDAIEVLNSEIPDNSVDLIFADPPYNIGKKFGTFYDKWPSLENYIEWSKIWIKSCLKKLKSNGSAYFMTSTEAMPHYDIFLQGEDVEILSRIIWSYDSSGVQAKKYYGSLYEPIIYIVKNKMDYTFNADQILVEAKTGAKRKLIDYRGNQAKPYNTKKVPGNVWEFPRVRFRMGEYENHPSQKPEAVLERIILASSNPGDLILDPFSGTFTTGAVAQRLGRKFIGIEQQLEYFKIGLRRLNISQKYNGEILKKPAKEYIRKNVCKLQTTFFEE